MRSRDPGDIAPSATHAVHGHPHPESHSPDRGQRLDRLPSAAPRGKGYARGRTNPRAIELGRHRESSEAKIEGCVFMAPGYRGDNQYSRAGPVGDPRHPPARTIGSPGTWQDAPDRPRARTGSGYQRSGLSPRHQIHRGSGLVAGVRLRGQGQWRTRTDLLTVDMTLRQPAQRHSPAPGFTSSDTAGKTASLTTPPNTEPCRLSLTKFAKRRLDTGLLMTTPPRAPARPWQTPDPWPHRLKDRATDVGRDEASTSRCRSEYP